MPSSSHISVLLEAFEPLPRTLALSLPSEATTADILAGIQEALHDNGDLHSCYLTSSTSPGQFLNPDSRPLSHRNNDDGDLVILRIHPRLLGGKGGFGSMLRAAGGKMSAKQGQNNTDSCRDLNGRRLSVMKEAKALATYIENEPARLKALNDAQQKKYAKLERMLGRTPRAAGDFEEAARRLADAEEKGEEDLSAEEGDDVGEGSSKDTTSTKRLAGPSRTTTTTASTPTVAGVKRKERLEDREYVEQSREIVDNVRNAVAAAMMKKRKKAKTAATSTSTSTSNKPSSKAVTAA
ncbi:hypothetical protein A4X13_0g6945 [Tilletia indica]|uniref:Uncharacterized protein n=1 Tax=Tilletia indica TaxID=43049 RepID=A0A177TM71_9BASI|nr:hypothetical protein A4X13_0g6945 [Tilletia indica]